MSLTKLALAVVAVSGLLYGQTSTGELDVMVHDPSGAVIPKAAITITGSATGNVARSIVSSESGLAIAPLLQPETYDIAVTMEGFEKFIQRGVDVRVGETVTLHVTLKPGNVNSEVTVAGQTPLIEEKSITVGDVVEQREMIDLPLNGRNYLELGSLIPGAVPSEGTRDQTFASYGNGGLQNAFLLDGGRNVNYLRGLDNRARDMVRPPLDALSQFQVQTSNYSAEFGSSAGAVVNAVTKSGTNQLHGSAYDFLRNDRVDAYNFFNTGTKPLFVQNQWGGSLGAPVVKNRAWVFGAYEGFHNRSEAPGFVVVPTDAQRNGDFGTIKIYDPLSTATNPSGSGYVRTQFPNNVIPASRFDKLGTEIANFYAGPNLSGQANNYGRNIPQLTDNKNLVVRGDTQISARDSMFVRVAVTRSHLEAAAALPQPAQAATIREISSEGIGYGYTRSFNATLINELRFSWTRLLIDQDETDPRNEIVPGILDPSIQHGTPNINVSGGFASIGAQPGAVGNSPLKKSSGVWDISDNVSKAAGKHLLKFGTDVQVIRPSTYSALNGRGTLGFTGVFTQNPQGRSGTGNGLADLLLGDANSLATGTVADAVERGYYGGWYIQDQWTVSGSLTLNLGLRYELPFPYVETQNRMANFVINRGDPLFGQYLMAGRNGQPRALYDMTMNNWAPRVGFAWRLPWLSNAVIRSSYGIFYAQDQGNGVTNRMTNNPPFYGYGSVSITSDQLDPSTGYVLSSGVPVPRPAPIDPSKFVLVPSSTTQLVAWDRRHPLPYVQQWNFSFQKQLPAGMVWETVYVGSIGIHLWGQTEGNQPLTNGPGAVNTRRPLAQYTIASIKAFGPWGVSTYEGISSRLQKRFSNGLSFLASFTHGRSIDLQNGALDACDSCANNTVQNSYGRSAQKGPSDNDVAFRFSYGGLWELPFGPGRTWLKQGWASQVAGHWQINTIYAVQTGTPFTATLNFDNANAGTVSYPNRICSGSLDNKSVAKWFDTSCFVSPPSYVFGNEGRNVIRAPGRDNVNIGLQRRFPLSFREGMGLEFRAEAYNLFNHPQFSRPAATVGNAGYGTITSTAVANRQLQFALRLAF
jgi:hypothetical protein